MSKAIVTFEVVPGEGGDLAIITEAIKKIATDKGSVGDMLAEEFAIFGPLKGVRLKAMFETDGNDFDEIAVEMHNVEGVETAKVASMDLPLG